MTEAAQLALIEFFENFVKNPVPIIGAVAALGALWKSSENSKLTKKVDAKADHITVLTNSTLTSANERIRKLEEIINELVADRDKKVQVAEHSTTAGQTASAILENAPPSTRKTGELPKI
jgi:hypothetical protein